MGLSGADPAQLRRLASRFELHAAHLQQVAGSLTARIDATHAWQGRDAATFRSTWSSRDLPSLTRSHEALVEAAKTLRRNADEQDRASEAGGGDGVASTSVVPHSDGTERAAPRGAMSVGDASGDAGWNVFETLWKYGREIPESSGVLMMAASRLGDVEKTGSAAQAVKMLGGVLTGENWGELIRGGVPAGEMSAGVRALRSVFSVTGRALPAIGAVVSTTSAIREWNEGDYPNAVYDGTITALWAVPLVVCPPAELFTGPVAAFLSLVKVVDPGVANQKSAVDGAVEDTVANVIEDTNGGSLRTVVDGLAGAQRVGLDLVKGDSLRAVGHAAEAVGRVASDGVEAAASTVNDIGHGAKAVLDAL